MSHSVREKLEEYFSTMNPTSSRMMADIKRFREEYSCNWEELNPDQQSAILWKCIVKPDALKIYENVPSKPIDVECFPILKICPGEKIIVEEDNVSTRSFGNSWRDEHSAPFRWETMSQLGFDMEDTIESQSTNLSKSLESVKKPEQSNSNVSEPVEIKKEEEVKRPATVKRPEVPPPPVPPHASPPVPRHVLPQTEKSDTPIYAKVMKRKSASSKTLAMSDMKAHRKAMEDMKPAVPPRMSLELKRSLDLTKYKTLPIDIDDIPKTGFDFLDNW